MSLLDQIVGRVVTSAEARQPQGPPPLAGSLAIPGAAFDGANSVLGANSVAQGQFYTLASGLKLPLLVPDPATAPRRPILLTRIYAPIAVRGIQTAGAALPTVAHVQIGMTIRSEPRWAWTGDIALLPNVAGTEAVGSGLATEDFVNPVLVSLEDQATLTYSISFDQAVGNVGDVQYWIYLAQQINEGAAAPVQPAAGAIYYQSAD